MRAFKISRKRRQWRQELESGDTRALLRIRARSNAAPIVANEGSGSGPNQDAALVPGHAERHRDLVFAGAVGALFGLTPEAAQQRGILPQRQRQHDGNESCTKHGGARGYARQYPHHTMGGDTPWKSGLL